MSMVGRILTVFSLLSRNVHNWPVDEGLGNRCSYTLMVGIYVGDLS